METYMVDIAVDRPVCVQNYVFLQKCLMRSAVNILFNIPNFFLILSLPKFLTSSSFYMQNFVISLKWSTFNNRRKNPFRIGGSTIGTISSSCSSWNKESG